MSNLLETLKQAHKEAAAGKVNDPRMNTILGHINQAIGILDPTAAGQASAAVSKSPAVLQQGRFGTTPPPQSVPANVNPYDLPKKNEDAVVVDKQPAKPVQQAEQETTDEELIQAKAQHGQLTKVNGDIVGQLSSLSVQEIARKYNKEQLTGIAEAVKADVEGMRSLKQMAAAIKTAIA